MERYLILAIILISSNAWGQTSPGLVTGQVPSAVQWNAMFSAKADYPITGAGCPTCVIGPTSATSNAIAKFDGTTGKILQNTLTTISAAGVLTVSSNLAAAFPAAPLADIGVAIGNNLSGSQSEVNLINVSLTGAGPRSFTFTQQTGATVGSDLMWINRTGVVNVIEPGSGVDYAALIATFSPRLLVAAVAGSNAIVGFSHNRVGDPGAVFPGALVGYSVLDNPGSTSFPIFSVSEQTSAGTAGPEFDCRNLNVDSAATLPPNRAFGTPDTVSVCLTLGAGGSHTSTIGMQIGQDGACLDVTKCKFVAGIYMNSEGLLPTGYGIFVDASTTLGAGTAAEFDIVGTGSDTALRLGVRTSTLVPKIAVVGQGGTDRWYLNSLGAMTQAGTTSGTVTIAPPAVAGTVSLTWPLTSGYVVSNSTTLGAAITSNLNGTWPALNAGPISGPTLVIGSNFSGSASEVNFINNTPSATASFRFHQQTGASAGTTLLTIGTTGTAVFAADVTATGYTAGASAGLSTTKTVRASGGAGDCTLIYTGGLLTGGSC